MAWLRGLKTTYYLRTMGATHAEKSTVQNAGQLNAVSSGGGGLSAAPVAATPIAAASVASMSTSVAPDLGDATPATDVTFCAIDDPGCEACQ